MGVGVGDNLGGAVCDVVGVGILLLFGGGLIVIETVFRCIRSKRIRSAICYLTGN